MRSRNHKNSKVYLIDATHCHNEHGGSECTWPPSRSSYDDALSGLFLVGGRHPKGSPVDYNFKRADFNAYPMLTSAVQVINAIHKWIIIGVTEAPTASRVEWSTRISTHRVMLGFEGSPIYQNNGSLGKPQTLPISGRWFLSLERARPKLPTKSKMAGFLVS